ncbi:hypothetical protein ILUMI_20762 [Ignelater luminosus]|uniref:Peptidase S1 domain-containing protein n=1 Tax=Ignelater luminosus TaxID=2038154 RepID=A0A8K0G215_IGNLU|nr:hypothetical protein ILUMI_20762 [Ignelater luminosus]
MQTQNETAREFAQDSQCGHDGTPLVCCGTLDYPNTDADYLISIFGIDTEVSGAKPLEIKKDGKTLIDLNSEELPDRSACGIQSDEDRIYGGSITSPDEFPWMVVLEFKNVITGQDEMIRCGGSIISKRFVLAAAHCIINNDFEVTKVRLGEWKLSSDPDCEYCEPVQKVRIAKIFPHPFYDSKTKNNNIALLLLEKGITFTKEIRPICLPPENLPAPEEGAKLTVAGQIRRSEDSSRSSVSGGVQGKGACQGDSGGPLIGSYRNKVEGRTQWYQEGIVSHGSRCGLQGYPGIYTRITGYVNWIIRVIEPEEN